MSVSCELRAVCLLQARRALPATLVHRDPTAHPGRKDPSEALDRKVQLAVSDRADSRDKLAVLDLADREVKSVRQASQVPWVAPVLLAYRETSADLGRADQLALRVIKVTPDSVATTALQDRREHVANLVSRF